MRAANTDMSSIIGTPPHSPQQTISCTTLSNPADQLLLNQRACANLSHGLSRRLDER